MESENETRIDNRQMTEKIIDPIDHVLIERELTKDRLLRPTNKGNNENSCLNQIRICNHWQRPPFFHLQG